MPSNEYASPGVASMRFSVNRLFRINAGSSRRCGTQNAAMIVYSARSAPARTNATTGVEYLRMPSGSLSAFRENLDRNFLFDFENGIIVHLSRLFATP